MKARDVAEFINTLQPDIEITVNGEKDWEWEYVPTWDHPIDKPQYNLTVKSKKE